MRDTTIKGVAVLIQHPQEPWYVGVTRHGIPGDWGLPGGKVEEGESLEAAAIREVLEETGLAVTLRPYPAYIGAANRRNCAAFIATEFTGDMRPSTEGDVAWVTRDQLLAGTFGAYHRRLFAALAGDRDGETPQQVIPRKYQKS